MKRKILVLPLAALVILVQTIAFPGAGQVIAQSAQEVRQVLVANTPSQPVPVSGTVKVGNTDPIPVSVQVGGAPSTVKIANSSAEPVPVAIGGDTKVILTLPSATYTQAGSTGPLHNPSTQLFVGVNITGATGPNFLTQPILNMFVESLGSDGVWYPSASSSFRFLGSDREISQAINLPGQLVASIGPGLNGVSTTDTIRLRWTLSNPEILTSVTFSATITGR